MSSTRRAAARERSTLADAFHRLEKDTALAKEFGVALSETKGWAIEARGSCVHWWSGDTTSDGSRPRFSANLNAVVFFARREDAERVIALLLGQFSFALCAVEMFMPAPGEGRS